MNKKLCSFILALTLAAAPQLCALKTISELLDDPAIIQANPQLHDAATRELVQTFYVQTCETPYLKLNEFFGDETTAQLEVLMDREIKNYFRSVMNNKTNETSLDKILSNFGAIADHIQEKHNTKPLEAAQFAAIVFSMRVAVAGLELSLEKSDKPQEAEKQDQQLKNAAQTLALQLEAFVQKTYENYLEAQ